MVVCLLLSFPVHFLKLIYPFIYFRLVALCGLSLVVASRATLVVRGPLIVVASVADQRLQSVGRSTPEQ